MIYGKKPKTKGIHASVWYNSRLSDKLILASLLVRLKNLNYAYETVSYWSFKNCRSSDAIKLYKSKASIKRYVKYLWGIRQVISKNKCLYLGSASAIGSGPRLLQAGDRESRVHVKSCDLVRHFIQRSTGGVPRNLFQHNLKPSLKRNPSRNRGTRA